jgi:hypothetical protein
LATERYRRRIAAMDRLFGIGKPFLRFDRNTLVVSSLIPLLLLYIALAQLSRRYWSRAPQRCPMGDVTRLGSAP